MLQNHVYNNVCAVVPSNKVERDPVGCELFSAWMFQLRACDFAPSLCQKRRHANGKCTVCAWSALMKQTADVRRSAFELVSTWCRLHLN